MTIPEPSHPQMATPPIPRPPQPVPVVNSGLTPNRALSTMPTTTDPNMVNAFTTLPPQEAAARNMNAFGPMEGSMGSPAGMRPAAPAMQPYMPQGMPAMQPGMNMQASYRPGTALPAGHSSEQAVPSTQELAGILKDSLYPSQREWAAEHLATADWHTQPHVVQALVTAAKDDPAATVRAACVRCLCRMGVNTVPVVSVIQGLKSDTDPRVRREADNALTALAPSQAEPAKAVVLPAGGVMPPR
jgi:hypothetical protein